MGKEVLVDCERCLEDLQAYLDGELDAGRRKTLLEHVDSCEPCRDELASLQALVETLDDDALEDPSPEFEAELLARLQGSAAAPRLRARFSWLVWAGGLAVILILFLLGAPRSSRLPSGTRVAQLDVDLVVSAGAVQCNEDPVSGLRPLREGDLIRCGAQAEAWLRWKDGTRVKVRADSSLLVFPRKLFLREGEVWVEVTKGRGGFDVTTPFAVAAVKGTCFTVRARGGGSEVEVHEGRVEVRKGRGSCLDGQLEFLPSEDRCELTAGRRARVRPESEYIVVDDFQDPASLLHDTEDFTVDRRRKRQ